jgi:flavin-dependent dehydrogenase
LLAHGVAAGRGETGVGAQCGRETAVRVEGVPVREHLVELAFTDDEIGGCRRLLRQGHLDVWSNGRVVLVGDPGYCAAPTAGMGTSQALIGARTLTRHLTTAGADHTSAFAAYEAELRPCTADNQQTGREGAAAFGART